jgi:hypothetical protein
LAIGCAVLAKFIPSYIDEIAWGFIAEMLEIDCDGIGATVRDVWAKLQQNSLPGLLKDYLFEAMARFILASWSTSRILEGVSGVRPERVYTRISRDRDLHIHQWLPA